MAQKRLKTKAITLTELGQSVALRRASLTEEVSVLRNDGSRRTASKRALLAAIRDVGGEW